VREGIHRVTHWETIANNLKKADGVWAACQRWIRPGERSGLLMRIAMMESGSLSVRMKT